MPLTPTQWSRLLENPAPSAVPKPAQVSRDEAEKALWAAVGAGDVQAASEALAAGARLTKRRKGRSPLWQAVHLDHWPLVEIIVQSGANLNEIHARRCLLSALVVRDDPTQAQRLVELGVDDTRATPHDFLYEQGAPRLLEWWIARDRLSQADFDRVKPEDWLRMGAAGSARLRSMINAFWGHDAADPNAFSSLAALSSFSLTRFWETVLHKDDPSQVKALLQSGWGFPAQTNYEEAPSWLPARCGAWDVVEWLCQSEEFANKMRADAQANPALSWWPAAVSRRAIERIQALGIDIESRDKVGATLAHYLCANRQKRQLPVPTIAWLQSAYPDLFQVATHAGIRPLDLLEDQELSLIQAHALNRATRREKAAPPRVISRL